MSLFYTPAPRRSLPNVSAAGLHLLFVVFICLGCVTPSHAVSVMERSFDDLISRADEVLYGKVTYIYSEPSEKRIFTYIRFSEIITVKGQVNDAGGEEYLLRMAGGKHGNRFEVYPGVPQFEVGKRYVIFVRDNNKVMFPLVGLKQGIFDTRYNTLSQQQEITPGKHTSAMQDRITALRSKLNITSPRALDRNISVDNFLDIIRGRKEHAL